MSDSWRPTTLAEKARTVGAIRARHWRRIAHPGQLPPDGDWRVWYAQGGRGSGKTRAGAEAFAAAILAHPPGEWAVVGPTFADARDTMVEHRKSGLLKVLGPNVRDWYRSNGELHVANGSIIRCDGAIEGAERIQGKELRGAWCIEGSQKVRLRRGEIPIRDVRVGDEAWTRKGWRPVTDHALTRRQAPLLRISAGGRSLLLTDDHPVWVESRGWVPAGQLIVGDTVYLAPASELSSAMNNAVTLPIVSSIEPAGRADVYDITVEGEHEFFAEGILVKNCDEIGLWRVVKERSGQERGGTKAWQESIEFAVREAPAIIYATGTPKGKQGIVRLLMEEPKGRVAFTFPSLADNKDNIDRKTYEGWLARWGGTRLGKQELEGLILEDVEGALWRLALIEELRVLEGGEQNIPGRTVVAIDPSATTTGDETGIVAAQVVDLNPERAKRLGIEAEEGKHGLVLADRSGNYTPEEWARTAIELYRELRADRIVAERNNGGEMVESVIRAVDPNVPVKLVWASKGKRPRAEPVAALYEKHRVHHVGVFAALEGEQTTWVPGEDSPNRMDALVWAISELMLDGSQDYAFAGFTEADPNLPVEEPITAGLLDRRW